MATLLVNAPVAHIADWLIRHTSNAFERTEYDKPDGRAGALNAGRRIGSRIVLPAVLVGPLDTATNSQTAYLAGDGIVFDLEALASERTRVTATCHDPRWLDYLAEVLGQLGEDYPEAAGAIFGPASSKEAASNTGKDDAQSDQAKATTPELWELVPDVANDRAILERWHAQESAAVIATEVGLDAAYVRKRISKLRKTHGDAIVPRRRT